MDERINGEDERAVAAVEELELLIKQMMMISENRRCLSFQAAIPPLVHIQPQTQPQRQSA
jgi:hypothetical protein